MSITRTPDIARRAGLEEDLVRRVVNAIAAELRDDNIVALAGFGRFTTRIAPSRRFTTPIIGDVITTSRRYVSFRQGAGLSRIVNDQTEE